MLRDPIKIIFHRVVYIIKFLLGAGSFIMKSKNLSEQSEN